MLQLESIPKVCLQKIEKHSKGTIQDVIVLILIHNAIQDTIDAMEKCKQAWAKYDTEESVHVLNMLKELGSQVRGFYDQIAPLYLQIIPVVEASKPKLLQQIYTASWMHHAKLVQEYTCKLLSLN